MAQKTRTQLASAITTLLADNTAGDISAADVRSVLTDLVDSLSNILDDPARPRTKRLTTTVNTSSATASAVTALRQQVLGGRVYRFKVHMLMQSSATGTSPKLGIGTDGIGGTIGYTVRMIQSTGSETIGRGNAIGQTHITAGTPIADTTFYLEMEGLYLPDADGEFGLNFGSSTDSVQVRLLAGTCMETRDVTNNF